MITFKVAYVNFFKNHRETIWKHKVRKRKNETNHEQTNGQSELRNRFSVTILKESAKKKGIIKKSQKLDYTYQNINNIMILCSSQENYAFT